MLADSLVAIGVIGEIYFSSRVSKAEELLRRKSDEKIADANERAAKANLELAKLQVQLAPRALTKEQYDILKTLKGQVSAVNITSSNNFEASRFAAQISQTLTDAGIKVTVCGQRLGLTWTEIYIVLPKAVMDFSKDPLYVAFKTAGLSVGCGDRTHTPMADMQTDIPVIMVGEKAPPSSYPAYPFTVPLKVDENGKII